MVVGPGLVNNHLHVSYAHAVRGIFPDDLEPAVYLGHVFALQSQMSEEDEYHTSLLGITELLRYGTTCFVDPGTTKFPEACQEAWERAGCRIVMGAQVVDQPNPLRLPVTPTDAAIRQIEDTIERFDGRLGWGSSDRTCCWRISSTSTTARSTPWRGPTPRP
jgi:cytosine/adenosine deaminase-related metal-dependent hydrolase